MPISEAREVILDMELERLLENVDLKKEAVHAVEESGIVFIDEIDKICSSRDYMSKSADASAEGVQRDLLPLIEGTTITTKYGNVNTDYILFIASGAFHAVKPSDMLPELQGRLPIRVELNGLTEEDLYKILTQPVANVSLSFLHFSHYSPRNHFNPNPLRSSYAKKSNSSKLKESPFDSRTTPCAKSPVWPPYSTAPSKISVPDGCTPSWSGSWSMFPLPRLKWKRGKRSWSIRTWCKSVCPMFWLPAIYPNSFCKILGKSASIK